MGRWVIDLKKTLHALVALAAVALCVGTAGAQEIFTKDDGVTLPSVKKEVRPQYTSDALHKKIQGQVGMSVVVQSDGKVGDVQVTESLDSEYGLDQEAVKAVKQWEFTPGQKDGKPVAVRVDIHMNAAYLA